MHFGGHYRCLKQILYFIHFQIKIEKIRQIEFYLLTLFLDFKTLQ